MLVAMTVVPLVAVLGAAQVTEAGRYVKPAIERPRPGIPADRPRSCGRFSAAGARGEEGAGHAGGGMHDMVQAPTPWTVTTPPLAPGFHYYSIIVDGASVADPKSETFFGVSKMMSGIEVPSVGEDFYAPQNVPHGEVREKW
jgi:hypothetical protein